jgi:hypothetical protein
LPRTGTDFARKRDVAVLGRDALFWAVLSNAAANGKRLRAMDALGLKMAGPIGRMRP